MTRAHADRLVGLHDEDEVALRAALHRGDGHQRAVVLGIHQQAHIDELVGEELALRIVELRAHLDRAGGRIDLIVDGGERAGRELAGLAAVIGVDLQRRARA